MSASLTSLIQMVLALAALVAPEGYACPDRPGLAASACVHGPAHQFRILDLVSTATKDLAGEWSMFPRSRRTEGVDTERTLLGGCVLASVAAGYMIYGYNSFWFEEPEPFHMSDEGDLERDSYVGGADKFGHAWGCHTLQRSCTWMLEWCGFSKGWSIGISAFLVQGLFLFAEVQDSYYDYGWSWGDFWFNLLGGALAAALDLVPWLDELIDFRIWYQPTPALTARGFNAAEDYSGQRYYLVLKCGGIPYVKETGLRFLELFAGFKAPGYRQVPEIKERHVFFGVSLDVLRFVEEFLWPLVKPPQEVRSWTKLVFENWMPDAYHAPLVDHVIP